MEANDFVFAPDGGQGIKKHAKPVEAERALSAPSAAATRSSSGHTFELADTSATGSDC
jgi:hypothetical protein